MQAYILGNTAVIRIKIAVRPLILLTRGLFPIIPITVRAYGHDVILTETNQCTNVKPHCHGPVLVTSDRCTIDIKFPGLTHTLKFEKNLGPGHVGRQLKTLAIPGNTGGEVMNIQFEGLILIPGIGQGHGFPIRIIQSRHLSSLNLTNTHLPIQVEIGL